MSRVLPVSFEIKTQVVLPVGVTELGTKEQVGSLIEAFADSHVQAHWDQIQRLQRALEAIGYTGILEGPEVYSLPDGRTKMHSIIRPMVRA